MENKYYIPEIKDLHVGYECEIQDAPIIESNWTFPTDRYTVRTNIWYSGKLTYHAIENIYKSVRSLKDIRVPYLTREQIEKEGWLLSQDSILTDDFGISIFGINALKNKSIDYTPKNHKLVIKTYLYNPEAPEYLFYGICKSINEFRTIIKLLNI